MIGVYQTKCSVCATSTGVMTCNGCQQRFCGKHSLEHRQQLANQLDGMIREGDSLRSEFERIPKDTSLLNKIDAWETESIAKIQAAAKTARQDLAQMIEKVKEPMTKAYRDMSMTLRSSREADDYSENELKRWMRQLQHLKSEIAAPLPIKLVEHEWSVIKLIKVKDIQRSANFPLSSTQDRFSKVIRSVTLDEDGLLAKHSSSDWNYEYILGEQRYQQGRHTVLFQIVRSGLPYNIFFGCISSEAIQSRISINLPSAVGWAGFNQVFQHGIHNGNPNSHGYQSNEIAVNDILSLTFDCDKSQVELFHEDTNKRHIINVDVQQAPLPWQLLMMLTDKDDCVRILRPPVVQPTMAAPSVAPSDKVETVAPPKKALVVQPKNKTSTTRPKGKAPTRVPKTRKT